MRAFIFSLLFAVCLPLGAKSLSPTAPPYLVVLKVVSGLGLSPLMSPALVTEARQWLQQAAAHDDRVARWVGMEIPAAGSIHGEVRGRARSTASLFHVSLYGEGGYQLIRSLPLDKDRGYRFEGLTDGKYWLEIDARGPTGVRVSPRGQWLMVRQGQPVEQHVTLE